MSELTASHCGCGGGSITNDSGCGSILWIIILLSLCGGGGFGGGCGNSCGGGCGGGGLLGGGDGCESIIFLILIMSCCGGCGGGNNNSCC